MSDIAQHSDRPPPHGVAQSAEVAIDHVAYTPQQRPVGEHGQTHGRPASWALIAVIILAFALGGVAIILHLWTILWVCIGVVALSVPAGKVIGIMNDTVTWYDPLAVGGEQQASSEDSQGQNTPGNSGSQPATGSASPSTAAAARSAAGSTATGSTAADGAAAGNPEAGIPAERVWGSPGEPAAEAPAGQLGAAEQTATSHHPHTRKPFRSGSQPEPP